MLKIRHLVYNEFKCGYIFWGGDTPENVVSGIRRNIELLILF